ncbi:MAG: processive 1,2-diacylglycerol beta-glucosyltransferase [Clostridiales bacterium]|jgi:processive 1,2-diacylglycerol beta-glucosyltransferase|nr:processive 1,2-diacylglycerol beta-glucosyltransferase [Clostridiales bacterium]MDN5299180.1 processive 1,2-diacylglycerol beta-glucosyltransferase [Clostridiales bacterium]
MKKVAIIFTAATGGGHNQAANALKNRLERQGITVEIVNLFKSCPKIVEVLVEDGYALMANHFSKLYGQLYYMSHRQTINKNMKKLLVKLMLKHMKEQIDTYQPDLLISTHPFFVNLMASLKVSGETNAKCISVITDLGVHRFYLHPAVDAYITGSQYTSLQLQHFGIEADRIFDFGIPVKDAFYTTSKQVVQAPKVFTALVMGGSMGSTKLIRVLNGIKAVQRPMHVHVVCGNNTRLRHYINAHCQYMPDHITLTVHGFINNVDELMAEADVLISKPGGLTATEALCKKLPMIIPYYIDGQEAENTEILATLGAAIHLKQTSKIADHLEAMMYEPAILEKMRFQMAQISANYSIEKTGMLFHSLIAS